MWLSEKRQIGLPNLEKGEKPLQNVAYERIERHLKDMIKILFVCHGNICRSPMAQCIFQKKVDDENLSDDFLIDSVALSREEIGNGIYWDAKDVLEKHHIPLIAHKANQITKKDFDFYDYIIGMEDSHVRRLRNMTSEEHYDKLSKLLDYTTCPSDISDPWYHGRFEDTYQEINEGCEAFLKHLQEEGIIGG